MGYFRSAALLYANALESSPGKERASTEDCWKEGLWRMAAVAYSTSIHIPLAETWPYDPTYHGHEAWKCGLAARSREKTKWTYLSWQQGHF